MPSRQLAQEESPPHLAFDGADSTVPGQLKAAAVRLFQQRGYSGVTVEDIVRAVGVTKGGFYHYFESKSYLLFQLHDEYVTYSIQRFEQAMDEQERPDKQLDAFVKESFRQINDHGDYVSLLFDERRNLPPDRVDMLEAKKERLRRLLTNVIDRGIKQGVFRDIDPRVTALAVFGMCTWGYQWFDPSGDYSWERLADQFAQLAQRGLKSR